MPTSDRTVHGQGHSEWSKGAFDATFLADHLLPDHRSLLYGVWERQHAYGTPGEYRDGFREALTQALWAPPA